MVPISPKIGYSYLGYTAYFPLLRPFASSSSTRTLLRKLRYFDVIVILRLRSLAPFEVYNISPYKLPICSHIQWK